MSAVARTSAPGAANADYSGASKGVVVATARGFCAHDGLHRRLITDAGYELRLAARPTPMEPDELRLLVSDADALILGLDRCDEQVFAAAKRLKVVARQGVGVDAVDLEAAARYGVTVTNTPGANTIAVAELVFGMLLSLARHLREADAGVKAGDWPHLPGWEIHGRSLGLIGLGQVGRAVASRAAAFGMKVWGYDPFAPEVPGVTRVPLADLFRSSDVISLHVPLTEENRNLIDDEVLAVMRPGAVVINTARGGLIDEAALARALSEGRIAAAASDAFAHEPPGASPLMSAPNFLATSHLGAATLESSLRMAESAARNALKVLAGEAGADIVTAGTR